MNTTDATYKVLKLLNGEELICELGYGEIEDSYEMLHPLKMQVESKVTKQGPVDSLNLSRWIGPYTEQSYSVLKCHTFLLLLMHPKACLDIMNMCEGKSQDWILPSIEKL